VLQITILLQVMCILWSS